MHYALTSPKWEGEIRLEYFDNGILKQAQFTEVIDVKAAMFMATHFPLQINLLTWLQENTQVKVIEILATVSFTEFWEAYNKKLGSKELARQYWEGEKRTLNKRPVNDTDRMAIMRMVKRFESKYKGEKKDYQPLASSFLHQRYWESESENTPKKNEAASNAAIELMNKWKMK